MNKDITVPICCYLKGTPAMVASKAGLVINPVISR
jgi:hypothetical protein